MKIFEKFKNSMRAVINCEFSLPGLIVERSPTKIKFWYELGIGQLYCYSNSCIKHTKLYLLGSTRGWLQLCSSCLSIA